MDALIGMRLWIAPTPRGLRPAWAAVAGMLAAGVTLTNRADTVTLFLTLVLVEALWGSAAGRLVGTEAPIAPLDPQRPTNLALPWMRSGSPAAGLVEWWGSTAARDWREGVVALAGALVISLLLGYWVVYLTLAVGLLAVIVRGLREDAWPRRLVTGSLTVGLPMVAGALVVGSTIPQHLIGLAMLFSLLAALAYPVPWRWPTLVVLVCLIGWIGWLRAPLTLAGVALLLFPTLLMLWRASECAMPASRWPASGVLFI